MARAATIMAMAGLGCVGPLPTRLDADDRAARVYAIATAATVARAEGYAPASDALLARGLTLVAQWGDDRGRYDAPMRRGPALPEGRRVVWDGASLLVVDAAAGAPLRRVRWPAALATAGVERVAVDGAGRSVAALDRAGGVWLGALDEGSLTALTPAPRAPAPEVDPARPEPPRFDSVSTEPWRGGAVDGRRPPAQRLFFSPDGARLAGAESVWEVASRRPLVTLRVDEALLAVDAAVTRAAVAALAVRTVTGSPGSQCGFIPTSRSLVVAAAESRALVGEEGARPITATLDAPMVGFDEPAVVRDVMIDARPVDAVAIDASGELAVAQDHAAWWVTERGARALAWPRAPRETLALAFTPAGVAALTTFDVGARMMPAVAVFGRDGRGARALAGGQVFAPGRAGLAVVRDEAWSLWDLARMERARGLPDPGALGLSSRDQARVSDAGAVVLRDEGRGVHGFLVGEGGGWRRVTVPDEGGSVWRWTLSGDGGRVALHEGHRLRVVDLRDGRVRWGRAYEGEAVASAFAGDRLYVGDDRGWVRAHAPDGEVVAEVELGARFDHATALAATPDGATLAVGTARGRAYVFRVGR